jgi:prepilin-type processing-associated H-X9-DG protein
MAVCAMCAGATVLFLANRRLRPAAASAALFAVVLLATGSTRVFDPDATTEARCAGRLKQLGLALLSYHATFHSFPPAYVSDAAGKPLCSWRVLLLPFIDETETYRKFRLNEPWDSRGNLQLVTSLPRAPFESPAEREQGNAAETATSYFAVVGPATAWLGARARKISDLGDPSRTVLLVEVAGAGVIWSEPCDIWPDAHYASAPRDPVLDCARITSSAGVGGMHVLFADGHVEFVRGNGDIAALVGASRATAARPVPTE